MPVPGKYQSHPIVTGHDRARQNRMAVRLSRVSAGDFPRDSRSFPDTAPRFGARLSQLLGSGFASVF